LILCKTTQNQQVTLQCDKVELSNEEVNALEISQLLSILEKGVAAFYLKTGIVSTARKCGRSILPTLLPAR
jgi:hypothetical protein